MNEGDAVAVEAEGVELAWGGPVRHGNGMGNARGEGAVTARGTGVRSSLRDEARAAHRGRGGAPLGAESGPRAGRRHPRPPAARPATLLTPLPHLLSLLLPLLLLLPFLTAAPALAAPSPPPHASTQAAVLAAHLRENPVYVTDQLPRAVPRSTAPDYARIAEGITRRTGVRTYVLVMPEPGASMESKALLGAVHDRLGRDGLYVLIDEHSVSQAVPFGVRAPAEDAWSVQLHELPYDAGPLLSFERFADVVAMGPEKAAQRAEAAREKYGSHGASGDGRGEEPDELHIGPTDRRNQSFLTGIALTGLPLLVLLISPYVRRWWRRRQPRTSAVDVVSLSKGEEGTAKPQSRPRTRSWNRTRTRTRPHPRTRTRLPHWTEAALALVLAAAVALTATALFDETTSSASPPPTAADMASRVDRVTDGLRRDPVYSDPESPRPLTDRQLDRLRSRMKDADYGSVYLVLVPQMPEDESAGDPEAFADALQRGLGRSGVYVVADPLSGDIDVVTYDVRIDANRVALDLPDGISYDASDERSEDHRLGERLGRLLTFLDDSPRTDTPETSSIGADAPDPVEDTALPRLFSTDFWPGLLVGAIGAVIVFGVVAGVLGILGRTVPGLRPAAAGIRLIRPGPEAGAGPGPGSGGGPESGRGTGSGGRGAGNGRGTGSGRGAGNGRGTAGRSRTLVGFDAPTAPSPSYLRRTAHEELAALSREFDPDAALPSALRTRVWDCLDTATLLADRDADGPDGRVDDDVPAADLAAAVTLARMGRAALANRDTDKPCCALNPLH
ncbi:hypothetical protein GT044_15265, partial [Streptomyces sp. SID335]